MILMNESQHFAALDLGSNSFHLIIARLVEGQLQPIFKFKQPVNLGQGLVERYLSDAAIDRGVTALQQCAVRLEGFAPSAVKVVATHTLRRAHNRKQFLKAAAQVLPFPIEIISGREEARLIYLGVSQTSAETGYQLIIDIGGGSTEFALGNGCQPIYLGSRSVGSLLCSERFFGLDKVTIKRFNKAVIHVRQQIEVVANELKEHQLEKVFGTSGTIKAIHQWVNKRFGEQQVLTIVHLHQCRDELLDAKYLSNLPSEIVSDGRRQSIAGGLAVLVGVFEELEIDSIQPHDSALREGVLYELAHEAISHQDVRERTIASLAQRYSVDNAQANRVTKVAHRIYKGLSKSWQLENKDNKFMLTGAARLHEIGLSISASGVQKHSGYILANAYMPGFNAEEQRFLAALVRFFRKKVRLEELPELTLFNSSQLVKLILILRLAVIFNSDRQDRELLKSAKANGWDIDLTLTKEAKQDFVLKAQIDDEAKLLNKLGYQIKWL